MKKRILVISSANMDLLMKMDKFPEAGQTIIEKKYDYVPGGKGANASVAFARLGADCIFCAKIGNDPNGTRLKQVYVENKIDTRFVSVDKNSKTGLAVVMVEGNGENRIVVYPGANYRMKEEDIEEAFISYPDALFLQLEIPESIVIAATIYAQARNIPVFMDAGPAQANFPLEKLRSLTIFSPNESETLAYTGIAPIDSESCLKACILLASRVSATYYVLKLGARGAFAYDGKYFKIHAPYKAEVVDTTAAGDAFSAAMTLEYLRSGDIHRACRYGNVAGALTVSKLGAMPSLPTQQEIDAYIEANEIVLD